MEQEKSFSVRFPEGLLKEIKQVAQEDKRSMNSEIVWIVLTYLETRKEQNHDLRNRN